MSDLIGDVLDGLYGPESDVGEFDREHLGDLLSDVGRYTHWTAHLWRLMVRADHANLGRLAHAFPKHYTALKEWRESELPADWRGVRPPALFDRSRDDDPCWNCGHVRQNHDEGRCRACSTCQGFADEDNAGEKESPDGR